MLNLLLAWLDNAIKLRRGLVVAYEQDLPMAC